VIKPSAKLAGQEDLASRKGTWKYEGDAGSGDASGAGSSGSDGASEAAGSGDAGASDESSAGAGSASAGEDYDGDGVKEGTEEGTRPEALDGPRGGKADNLKEIKGIGPKLEKLCHRLGFYHFDQIANWTDDEVAWVNANLEGFKGRVSRDEWVKQAKILASGGETEFSKRVEDGDVY
jgi:predicted flap endonuclease-1-like 5' DNA nuclease